MEGNEKAERTHACADVISDPALECMYGFHSGNLVWVTPCVWQVQEVSIEDEKGALSQDRRRVGPALLRNKQANKLLLGPCGHNSHHTSITSLKINAQVYPVAIVKSLELIT